MGDAARTRELNIASRLIKPPGRFELKNAIVEALGLEPQGERPWPLRPAMASSSPLLRVLLAEDNPVNQLVAVRLLQRKGCEVTVVSNGRQAVDQLDSGRFDLVLMDVQMPELDGLEATAEWREKEKTRGDHTPIIAMTAHAMQGDRERCLAAGMDGYVSKPFHAEEIFPIIQQVLAEAGSRASG